MNIIMQQKTGTGNNETYDCIICAAGESRRMGEWKPLLPWRSSTLVEESVDAALKAGCRVILVTGAKGGLLEELFAHTPDVITVRNDRFEKGMVSSIRCGAELVSSAYFFIAHADMPQVPARMYRELIDAARSSEPSTTNKPRVIRPRFAGVPGHPVLFDRNALPLIANLPDGESMKDFLKQCALQFLDTDERGVILDLDDPKIYSSEVAGFDLERARKGILVLTGEKGTGKTTRIRRVFDCAASRKMNAVLVCQTETGRSADGRATGFEMEMTATYTDGDQQKLTLPLARNGDAAFDPVQRIELGPFIFDRTVFDWALRFVGDFIERTDKQERFFGIDEIGKLELERADGLLPALKTVAAAVRKARADGAIQFLACTARYDTLDKLEIVLTNECLETDIQLLPRDQKGATI